MKATLPAKSCGSVIFGLRQACCFREADTDRTASEQMMIKHRMKTMSLVSSVFLPKSNETRVWWKSFFNVRTIYTLRHFTPSPPPKFPRSFGLCGALGLRTIVRGVQAIRRSTPSLLALVFHRYSTALRSMHICLDLAPTNIIFTHNQI